MRKFLQQNRVFLIVSLTITVLALLKVNQAHAMPAGNWDGKLRGDQSLGPITYHYDKNSVRVMRHGIIRFTMLSQTSFIDITSQFEIDCFDRSYRTLAGMIHNGPNPGAVDTNPHQIKYLADRTALEAYASFICKNRGF